MNDQNTFKVTGHFYKNANGERCRKYVDIKSTVKSVSKPELVVLMLNPGSCGDREPMELDKDVEIPPDATLSRIQAFMKEHSLAWVKILNLSDLQEKSSDQFFKTIGTLQKDNLPIHSLFHPARENELMEQAEKGVPFLLAWGLDARARILADTAISRLKERGYKIVNENGKPYHPLTRPIKGSPLWLTQASEQYKLFMDADGNLSVGKDLSPDSSRQEERLADRINSAFKLFSRFEFGTLLITSAKENGRWNHFARLLEQSDLKPFRGTDDYDYIFVDRVSNAKELFEVLERHNGKKIIFDAAANPKILSMKGGIEWLEAAICPGGDSNDEGNLGQDNRPFVFTGKVAILVAKSEDEVLRDRRLENLVRDCIVV